MLQVALTPEQAQLVARSTDPVEIRDPEGKLLACIPTPSETEIIARAKRSRANQPRYPSEVVQARLGKVAEVVQRDGLDETGALALLERLRAEDRYYAGM